MSTNENNLTAWAFTAIGGFALICIMLKTASDSFGEVTATAFAGTVSAGVLCVVTLGMLKDESKYTPRIHFLVLCAVMAVVSLRTKFAL